MLDYRQEPHRLTVPGQAEPVTVTDETVALASSCEIQDRDEICVAGYAIKFRVGEEKPIAKDDVPMPLSPPGPGPPPPPDDVPVPPGEHS